MNWIEGFISKVREEGRRRARSIAAALVLTLFSGCVSAPFNVKSKPDTSPAAPKAGAVAGGLQVRAETITDEEYLVDNFDANLILAGVLPVKVVITNSETSDLELRKAEFKVQAGPVAYKAITAKQAYRRLMKYYQIHLYSKDGYKESLGTFISYWLDTLHPISAGSSRDGLLFFEVPADTARAGGLILKCGKTGMANLEIKLN